jgi:hypothetical protein
MFHGKSMIITWIQHVADTQTVTIYVNVVDVNVATISKITEEQVLKDRELKKTKSATN